MTTGSFGQKRSFSCNNIFDSPAPPPRIWSPHLLSSAPHCTNGKVNGKIARFPPPFQGSSASHCINGNKNGKIARFPPPFQGSMTAKERPCMGFFRLVGNKRIGMFAATLLACFSLFMLITVSNLVSSHFKEQQIDLKPQLPFARVRQKPEIIEKHDQQQHPENSSEHSTYVRPDRLPVSDLGMAIEVHKPRSASKKGPGKASSDLLPLLFWNFNASESRSFVPRMPSDYPLPPGHPCEGFTLPPPPADKKRTGPRPCPVCYLPVKEAIKKMPAAMNFGLFILKNLSYAVESPNFLSFRGTGGSDFGGHFTLEDRNKFYDVKESMHVNCGFVKGAQPGLKTGFDLHEDDRADMEKCKGVVVASAIFGNYDQMQQPKNISKEAVRSVCFFMFVDEETEEFLKKENASENSKMIGLWRVVVVHNLPYSDARRNGKIPKLLLHRLFPNARFSLWIDGKLELVVDPYQILERFLWRGNNSFAISQHYKRLDVFEEAEANKAAGKYDNASIDAQVDFYRREGLKPFNFQKFPIISDVPEGCVIIREHTPISNLFSCLWFNEVDLFTARDQLSFGIVRDKIIANDPWQVNMFFDCERRNFVVQGYHRDVLEQKKVISSTLGDLHSVSSIHDPLLKSVVDKANEYKQSPKKASGKHHRERRGSSSRHRINSGKVSARIQRSK